MVTPGSWWKNVKTGQRLVAPKYSSVLMTESILTSNNAGRYTKKMGLGRHPDLKPYYAEGPNQYLRWLADEELRALHKPYRPDGEGRVSLPKWLTKSEFNDFILDKDSSTPLWCAFHGARGSCGSCGDVRSEVVRQHDENDEGRPFLQLGRGEVYADVHRVE